MVLYNEKLYSNGNYYYLYVDINSYYYKKDFTYEENKESLMSNLASHVQNGDTILVKASHFMQFDDVVKALENM